MFNKDFYPTPSAVLDLMLAGEKLAGKRVLEPSAGKGDIVDYLKYHEAEVVACENDSELVRFLFGKCHLIGTDFLQITSDQVSHIDMVVMNPPFSADEKHILHAYEIAPPGCKIIALCNWQTIENPYTRSRSRLETIIANYGGTTENLGNVFKDAERATPVEIGLIKLVKPGGSYDVEFEGFFLDEDPPENSDQPGIMSYNFVRDIVNRYVAAVKLYDKQLQTGLEMNALLSSFYSSKLSFSCNDKEKPILRNEFKKDLQKNAWSFVFQKMGMDRFMTKKLKDQLNKFVETQQKIPFTMRNIYAMLDMVAATHAERMDTALIDIFDKLTLHHDENRYNVEGWKTNSHYLVNQKFIMPWLIEVNYSGGMGIRHNGNYELIDDMHKGLCYLMGQNYDEIGSIWSYYHRVGKYQPEKDSDRKPFEFNTWYDFGFFSFKGYKKGTAHFKFKDDEVWGRFNQRIAKLKGYPLFEPKK